MLWCPEDEGALPRSAMSDDVHFAECAPSIMDLSRCEPCVAGVPTHSGLSDVLGIAQAEKDSEALCGAPNDDDDYYGGGICSLEL